MNCADAVAQLSAALDGELPPAAALEVHRHLATCDACARRLRTLQQVRAAVKAAPFAPVSGTTFDAGVLERVRHEAPPAVRVSRAWLATAAALIVAVSSAVLLVNEHAAPVPAHESLVPPALGTVVAVPGGNEGRASEGAECGLAGYGPCVIEGGPALLAGN